MHVSRRKSSVVRRTNRQKLPTPRKNREKWGILILGTREVMDSLLVLLEWEGLLDYLPAAETRTSRAHG